MALRRCGSPAETWRPVSENLKFGDVAALIEVAPHVRTHEAQGMGQHLSFLPSSDLELKHFHGAQRVRDVEDSESL